VLAHAEEAVVKIAIAGLFAAVVLAGVAACQTDRQYDGVSRFADEGTDLNAYYGPASPPRDFGVPS
jgi:hypothetical protein